MLQLLVIKPRSKRFQKSRIYTMRHNTILTETQTTNTYLAQIKYSPLETKGQQYDARAQIDSGSQYTLISEKMKNFIKISTRDNLLILLA